MRALSIATAVAEVRVDLVPPCLEGSAFAAYLTHLLGGQPHLTTVTRGTLEKITTFNSRFYRRDLPSPKDYLAGLRLWVAAHLLADPSVTIAAAAQAMHYSTAQAFGRHIRHRRGVTATEWRLRGPAHERGVFHATLINPYTKRLLLDDLLVTYWSDFTRQARAA